jgi:transposase
MADLFGLGGRRLLSELDIPEPWRDRVDASVELIDELELRISRIEHELQRSGADHRYVPILMSALRGPVSKRGPRYLRWGLMEAAVHAYSHPLYQERYQRLKRRHGRQRGAKVAQIELSRQLATAIWYRLTRNQPFAPAGATFVWLPDSPFWNCATGASPDRTQSSKLMSAIEK